MTYAAVVVSYNRIALLKECLAALHRQTLPLNEIIVVDNGSTDGSADFVAANYPEIVLHRTGENLGGAGGFAWGIDIAIARGHQAAWLMDDDARPEDDAFAPLADTFERMEPTPSFLASVVTIERGVPNISNSPSVSTSIRSQFVAQAAGGIAADAATFVGVLINLKLAAQTYLPLDDYFIWLDDAEYTARLSAIAPAMSVPASMVNHPDSSAKRDMGGRLFYFTRNRIWQIRAAAIPRRTKIAQASGVLATGFGQLPHAASKRVWLSSIARGVWQGWTRTPRHRLPGEFVATLKPSDYARVIG